MNSNDKETGLNQGCLVVLLVATGLIVAACVCAT